jgi:cytochrome c biogenesis protein CcmG, thiol:disulfide interchange protein DsbE
MKARIFALAIVFGLSACGTPEIARAPDVGAVAPEFAALTLSGDSASLADYHGEVILLNVWATWCIPCREEIPALQRLHDAYSEQGLRIVGVSVDAAGEAATVREFVQSFGVGYDIWLDPAEQIISTFRVIGVPNTFLIDREGVVRWKHIGAVLDDDPELLGSLRSALREGEGEGS